MNGITLRLESDEPALGSMRRLVLECPHGTTSAAAPAPGRDVPVLRLLAEAHGRENNCECGAELIAFTLGAEAKTVDPNNLDRRRRMGAE